MELSVNTGSHKDSCLQSKDIIRLTEKSKRFVWHVVDGTELNRNGHTRRNLTFTNLLRGNGSLRQYLFNSVGHFTTFFSNLVRGPG